MCSSERRSLYGDADCAADVCWERRGLRDFWASTGESFGESLEGLGTEKHSAVGGFDKVKRFLFHPPVENSGSEPGYGGGGFDGEHYRLCPTSCTVKEDSLSTRLPDRDVLALD